jgi:hypothetical protein
MLLFVYFIYFHVFIFIYYFIRFVESGRNAHIDPSVQTKAQRFVSTPKAVNNSYFTSLLLFCDLGFTFKTLLQRANDKAKVKKEKAKSQRQKAKSKNQQVKSGKRKAKSEKRKAKSEMRNAKCEK